MIVLYLLIPLAFIIGSIPFGIIFTRKRGIDLRTTGSRNIGTTNVLRTAGKIPAIMTLAGDTLKGVIPVLLCRFVIDHYIGGGQEQIQVSRDLWEGIIGLSAVLGHVYSVFLSFKGGKGVATAFGALAVYASFPAVIMLIIWLLVAVLTRYSSLAALSAFVMLPVILNLLNASATKISFGILFMLLIVLKHRANIKRLIKGTESKIGKKVT